jgi:hypothetical protein
MIADLVTRMDFYADMLKANTFTRSALAVAFCLLYRHLNGRTGRCDPSISTLADKTGLTKRSVNSAVDELRKSGWWRVANGEGATVRGGRTNSYAPRFDVVKRESGEANDTSSGLEVVKRSPPVHAESGETQRQKVVKQASPKPVRNQESYSQRAGARRRERVFRDAATSKFDAFWRVYPHRTPHANPKKPAALKFEAAIKRGVDPAEIIAGAERYAAYVAREAIEPRFVAQAVTWLNQERWRDDHQQRPAEPPRLRVGMN